MNENMFETGIAVAGAGVSWFFGGLDSVVKILIAFTVIDYASGVTAAVLMKKLSSSAGFRGIAKKIMIFLIVGVANVLDKELLGGTDLLKDAVCFFYLGNEGLSIIENAIAIGLPVPEFLKEKIAGFTEAEKKG